MRKENPAPASPFAIAMRAFTVRAMFALAVFAGKAFPIVAMAGPIDIIQKPCVVVADEAKSGLERRLPVVTAVNLCD
jgi:hypothetical protein